MVTKGVVLSKIEKLKKRLFTIPNDYTYSEAKTLLIHMGFSESNKGKTSGSRVKFYRELDSRIIMLHKPHPTDVMSVGAIKSLARFVKEIGD